MGKKLVAVAAVILILAGISTGLWFVNKPQPAPVGKVVIPPAKTKPDPLAAAYAGSLSCRGCHKEFYKLWSTSHHGLAMQPFTAEFARKELVPPISDVVIRGVQYRAELALEASCVAERGPAGEKRYPIVHVMGGKNIYYFLTSLERGRLQVLPVAYDVRRKEWFDTTGSAMRHFGDRTDEALDWRERPLTFNTSCFNCHVSQLSKNYDLKSDSYRSIWQEPGINCETCHGPAAEHVRLFKQPGSKPATTDIKLITMRSMRSDQRNDTCAPCHAKMSPLTSNYRPGDRYFDHYDLGTLEDRDFYPDARDLGENYTITQWRMSPCVKAGNLDCLHCHTSSGRNKFTGADANKACLPCHATVAVNLTAHTHHKADSAGSQCVSCHMAGTEFARMHRTDHSMRPPTPATTLAYKSPNACNGCHADKDAAWANDTVRKWYPKDYQAPVLQLAGLLDSARKRDWSKLTEILDYIGSPTRDELHAASFVRLLTGCPDDRKWPVLLKALRDHSPLVRSRAAEALTESHTPETIAALVTATTDDYRLVRIRAAIALSGYPAEQFNALDRQSLARATDEYLASLTTRPDDSGSHYNLGNFQMARQDYTSAISSFETAIKLQPDSFAPMVNAALSYNALGQNDKAESVLRRAIQLDPTNAVANLNLGLLLGEVGRIGDAEKAFRTALRSDPKSAVAAYNLAVLVSPTRLDEAVRLCRTAAALAPQEPKYSYTLAYYQRQKGLTAEAIRTLEQMITETANYPAAYELLSEIFIEQKKLPEALQVYKLASENPKFSMADRAQFALRLKAATK